MNDRRRQIRTLNLLRLLFSALAIGLIIAGLYTLRERGRSRGWVAVDGRVASSRVAEFEGTDGRTYRPMVVYNYSVGTARFMSNRIAFHSLASTRRSDAEKVAGRYPPNTRVRVHYNPHDPEQAVLEPGDNPWIWIGLGGGFSMLGVWMRIRRGRLERSAR